MQASNPLHRGAFCQSSFLSIYYYGSNKSTGNGTGKSHLFALFHFQSIKIILEPSVAETIELGTELIDYLLVTSNLCGTLFKFCCLLKKNLNPSIAQRLFLDNLKFEGVCIFMRIHKEYNPMV